MTRRLTALALALVLALTLNGCWEDEPEPDDFWNDGMQQEEAPPEEPLLTAADFTLPYLSGQSFDPVTCIDGVQQTVGALLYEPLFAPDRSFETKPVLCESMEQRTDEAGHSILTLTLRGDAVFSDGSPLTAKDVLATYRRAAESERYDARFANVVSMTAQGDRRLVITLAQENVFFDRLLDIPIVKAGTEGALVPLGTGPYVYTTDAGGASLTAATGWWRGETLPLARIALAAAKDNDTAASLFASQIVHFLLIDPVGTAAVPTSGAVTLTDIPTTILQYLGFNLSRAPLGDAAVRRAMSGVLDREALVSSLLSGHGTAAQFPLLPQALSPSDRDRLSQCEYRTSAADYAAALEAAGVTAARTRSLTLLVNEENSFKRTLAESLCAQLSTSALTVTVRVLPWADYLDALQRGDFDLYFGEVRLTADCDAGALLDADGALNYGGFVSEALSTLSDSLLRGGSDLTAMYAEGFAEETPFAPLLFKAKALITPAGLIEGMTPSASNPFDGLEHWTVRLSGAES